MKTQTDTQKDTALDLAKRGILVINNAARDKILSKHVGMLPPAFMNAAQHWAYNALQTDFFRAAPRLRTRKPENDLTFMFFGAQVTEGLQHLTPNCHPEPHPHY